VVVAVVEQAAELRQQAVAVQRAGVERPHERADPGDPAVLLAGVPATLAAPDEDECAEREQHGRQDRDQGRPLHARPETSSRRSRYRRTATLRSASAVTYSRPRLPISSRSSRPSCARRISSARSSGRPGGSTTPQPTRSTSWAVSLEPSAATITGLPTAMIP